MRSTHKLILIIYVIVISCSSKQKNIAEIRLTGVDESDFYMNDLESYKATVVTFLSPECPVSENYTKIINEISQVFGRENQVNFINVFPGEYYSPDKINNFIDTYHLIQKNVNDKELLLTKNLGATITPETFVLNNQGKVVYSGAIDNWAVDLGSKRQVTTEFYLKDALNAVLENKLPKNKKTKAVGCFIEETKHLN